MFTVSSTLYQQLLKSNRSGLYIGTLLQHPPKLPFNVFLGNSGQSGVITETQTTETKTENDTKWRMFLDIIHDVHEITNIIIISDITSTYWHIVLGLTKQIWQNYRTIPQCEKWLTNITEVAAKVPNCQIWHCYKK